ncbi:alkaline phosphatase family protein, partial [Bordetella pertussis]|uniref:alkaline phosphatase family protein n=1 Tax=Bordetella pertussis TaxID=520 RepID=UPI0021CC0220
MEADPDAPGQREPPQPGRQRRSGTLRALDHIVILMQENRGFDHYYGALPGARGRADPHRAPTPD